MRSIDGFGETQDVEITVLVDNRADLMVKSTDTVKYFYKEFLLAEHGFSALIELKDAGIRILWDAGVSRTALLENAWRMEIDLSTVDVIALSHGHLDHCAALTDVVKEIGGRPAPREWDKDATLEEIRSWVRGQRVPLIAHPAAFRERWGLGKDGKKYGPQIIPLREWEAAGAEIIFSDGPYKLGPGCWTTGAVPRLSFEHAGTPTSAAYREGDQFIRDLLDDDQAIIFNIRRKGLVILTGCAHAGIVNTVRYAREISGVDEVWAILGGFHLGRATDDDIDRTIDEVAKTQPQMVAPMHCSGFEATARIARRMPQEFVLGVVGTKFIL